MNAVEPDVKKTTDLDLKITYVYFVAVRRYLIDVSEGGTERLRNSSQHSCGSENPLFCAQELDSTIKTINYAVNRPEIIVRV